MAQFPPFVRANDPDMSAITVEPPGFPTVEPMLAEGEAAAVTAFVAAVAKGRADAITDLAAEAAAVIVRTPAGDVALETRRLELAIEANVVTGFATATGMGDIDPERVARALAQLAKTCEFRSKLDLAHYFTDAYLPRGQFPLP